MKNDPVARLKAHPRGAMRVEWQRDSLKHKFGVGDVVTLVGQAGEARSKAKEQETEPGRFQVTRPMPLEGAVFQYRIKDMTTGRERVVAEQQILAFQP